MNLAIKARHLNLFHIGMARLNSPSRKSLKFHKAFAVNWHSILHSNNFTVNCPSFRPSHALDITWGRTPQLSIISSFTYSNRISHVVGLPKNFDENVTETNIYQSFYNSYLHYLN